jgi:hypothetical protein
MCRGRRARILLHLHIQLEGTVLRGSPRVQKLVIHESRMTRVVNGVRHTSLCDTLDRRNR